MKTITSFAELEITAENVSSATNDDEITLNSDVTAYKYGDLVVGYSGKTDADSEMKYYFVNADASWAETSLEEMKFYNFILN